MKCCKGVAAFLIFQYLVVVGSSRVILTIEVKDGAKDCYYETVDLTKHTGEIEFEFAVLDGGSEDIDTTIEDPDGVVIYTSDRYKLGVYNWNTTVSGDIKICFSNEFSTFTDKTVYFELEVHLKPEKYIGDSILDSEFVRSVEYIDSLMASTFHSQRAQRTAALKGFKTATELHERIHWAAGLMTLALLFVTIGQVIILKRFFAEKSLPRKFQGITQVPVSPLSNFNYNNTNNAQPQMSYSVFKS